MNAMRKWGPFTAIMAALAVMVGLVVTTPEGPAASERPGPGPDGPTDPLEVDLPDGVMPFRVAAARGTVAEYEWGPRCDLETGALRLPLVPTPECFAVFTGDNGGPSGAPGVSGDAIRVVVYTSAPDDPILSLVYSQIGAADTPDDAWDTYNTYNTIFGTYYETYGRKVELVRYTASGNIMDNVAAIADAERIAREYDPFLVIGGPLQTASFAEKLAQLGVMCMACAPGQPGRFYEENDPFIWDVFKQVDQGLEMTAEYLGKRIFGRPARWAGDAALRDRERRVALIRVRSSESSEALLSRFLRLLEEDHGAAFAEIVTYDNPITLAGSARDIITRLQASGITTIVFAGDPIAPKTLTETATEQGYFPEWVITGTVLVDTTVFGRTYDQRQWANAFGISNLLARIDPEVAGAGYLHRWFWGRPPAASSSALIVPGLQVLYGVIQGMGPQPTYERWRNALFATRIEGNVLQPQLTWGRQGVWPDELGADYAGIDDQVEVWWNPEEAGPDEIGNEGRGMWMYADGGKRYLPGEWPEAEPRAFDPEGAVGLYRENPLGDPPDYEPLRPRD